MSQLKEVTLSTVADGVAQELFQHEIMKIAANILDPNTSAETKRKLTLSFEFAPDEDRDEVKCFVEVKTTLAPTKGHAKTVHMGKKNGGIPVILDSDTKQTDLFEEEEGTVAMKGRRNANA